MALKVPTFVVSIYTFLQLVLFAPGELHDVYVIAESEVDYRR